MNKMIESVDNLERLSAVIPTSLMFLLFSTDIWTIYGTHQLNAAKAKYIKSMFMKFVALV